MSEYMTIDREDALASVGIGWAKLINALYDNMPESVRVLQVKEKFGGLRFYVVGASEEFSNLIDKCEAESEHICEYCGKPGKLRKLSWIKTLCNEHYEDEQEYQKLRNEE